MFIVPWTLDQTEDSGVCLTSRGRSTEDCEGGRRREGEVCLEYDYFVSPVSFFFKGGRKGALFIIRDDKFSVVGQ